MRSRDSFSVCSAWGKRFVRRIDIGSTHRAVSVSGGRLGSGAQDDALQDHHPDRLDIELYIDRDNLGASTWFSLPLYERGMRLWRRASG
jgi:hypothetical protein